jgi:hypothetical protein
MRDTIKKSFNKRAFVALTAASACLGLPITGLANHLFQLEPMGFQRHAWMSAHNGLGVLFLIFVIWHTILNRRALFNYVRGAYPGQPGMSREVFWAVAFVAAVLCIGVGHALHVH